MSLPKITNTMELVNYQASLQMTESELIELELLAIELKIYVDAHN